MNCCAKPSLSAAKGHLSAAQRAATKTARAAALLKARPCPSGGCGKPKAKRPHAKHVGAKAPCKC